MSAGRLVLFDLDGVLAHYDHAARLEALARRSGATVEAVSRALFESGLEREADLGAHDARGQADELARRLGAPVTLEDCVAARRASMRADAAVLALAAGVARRARVAILTNNNLLLRDHLPAICAPLFPLFDGRVFCSAQYRLAKPDPAIFLRCLDELGVAPAQAFFIDDKRENADGARAAGLRAHHYQGLPALQAALREAGFAEE